MPRISMAKQRERDLAFLKAYEAGASLSQIAKDYPESVTPKTVSNGIKRAGGQMRSPGGDNKSKRSIFRTTRNNQMKLPTAKQSARMERDKKWREEYEAGATLQQMADRYSMSIHAIKHGVERAGGEMRAPGYLPGDKDKNKPKRGLIAWLNA